MEDLAEERQRSIHAVALRADRGNAVALAGKH